MRASITVQEKLDCPFDLRATASHTRRTYRLCIGKFERFAGRSVCELGREQVEHFLLHLVRERKVSPATHNVYVSALTFLFEVALDRPDAALRVPRRKQPCGCTLLAVGLGVEEVRFTASPGADGRCSHGGRWPRCCTVKGGAVDRPRPGESTAPKDEPLKFPAGPRNDVGRDVARHASRVLIR